MVSLGTPIYVSVRALTDKIGPDISRGLSGANRGVRRDGENLGRAFTDGFNRGIDVNAFRRVTNGLRSMVPEAEQARKAFSSLIRTSYTLGTALTGVVGGVSAVVSSLGALAGSAGGAISTVSVLGNAVFALGSGFAAVKLATSGVGGALQKLRQQTSTTAATATRSALQAVRDNQARELATRRIEDAERSLARVVESNRDRIVRANQEIEDAQRSLNEAIRDGREELQQVGFEAEDAALAEQRAALELDRAREVLARTQDLPPNDRRRREAEIAYQEAELNYRKAADANADLQKESDRLARTGVNGLKSVIDARNDVAEAEENKAQVIKDALQDEEDALRNVAEARRDAANVDDRQEAAADTGGAGPGAAVAAWDEGLNDAQRRFALFINSLKPQFDELERIAAEAFLPRLQTAIETLMEKAYPVVAVGIGVVATAMGEAAITLADFITTSDNLRTLAVLFDSSGRLIETFGEILGRSYGIILSILEATAPMAERFFTFLNGELSTFDNYLNSVAGNAAMTDFFSKAEYTAKQFGDVFGNVFRGIGGVISANIGPDTGGGLLLDYFERATSDWGSSTGLQTFFLNVANNATKVLDVVGELFAILGRVGENQNLGKAFEVLLQGAPALENILQVSVDAAPYLAELLVTVTNIISAMSDTGAMQVFFETLNNIFGAVLDFVSDPGNKEFMDYFGRIFAVFSAVGFAGGLVAAGLKIATGSFIGLLSPIAAVMGTMSKLKDMFGGKVTEPLKDGLGALSGQFDSTGSHKDDLIRNLGLFDKKLAGSVGASKPMVVAMENVGGTFRLAGADAVNTTTKVGLMATAMAGLKGGLSVVGGAFATAGRAILPFLGPVGLVIGIISALVGLFMLLYNTNAQFKADMDKVWADLSKTFMDAGQQIMDALVPLGEVFGQLVAQVAPLISMLVVALVPVFTTLIGAVVPLVSALVTGLVPVISTIIQAVVPLISLFITGLVPVIQILVNVLSFLIQIIAAVVQVIVTVLAAALTFIIGILTAVISSVVDFIKNFGSNWESFWSGVGKFLDDAWKGIQIAIGLALQFIVDLFLNWTLLGLIIKNWEAISKFFDDTLKNIANFFLGLFEFVYNYVIKPMLDQADRMARGFEIMGQLIGIAWDSLMRTLDTVWKLIDKTIFRPIRDGIALVREAFELAVTLIRLAWEDMQAKLFGVVQWIGDNVFNVLTTAVNLVQQTFENVARGIATAWDGIKAAAAGPVNFVIDTVYNNGLRNFWNGIANNLGMKNLELPYVPKVAFATGGVMPGYTPGKDVHKFYSPTGGILHLSGGEAIMRPEWTRAVGGPAAVERMNRAARSGQAFSTGGTVSRTAMRTQKFASGGILDFAGDVLDNLGKLGNVIGDFVTDPKSAMKKYIVDGVIRPLASNAGGGLFGSMLTEIPVTMAGWLGDAVKKLLGEGGGGKGTEGMGWQAMWQMVKNAIPGAVKTSDYRPGSVTVNGGKSYHGSGRAIDVIPASMETFNRMLALFPNARELIYSPAGGRQLLNGKPHYWTGAVRATHFDHVHAAMANGGTVFPSRDGTIVQVAEAGRAERIEPLDQDGISERDKAWAELFTKGMPRGEVKIYVTARENEDTEALAQRVAQIVNDDIRSGSAH